MKAFPGRRIRIGVAWLAFLAGLISFCRPALAAEHDCDQALVSILGESPHRQCVARAIPEFADYQFDGCTLNVYLTDLSKSKEAEAMLAPFFREHATCPSFGKRRLEFRQAKYSYLDLARWAAEARDRLYRQHAVNSVSLFGLEIEIFVAHDAQIAQAVQVLGDIGVPTDAYKVSSRETELRNRPSMVPSVRPTESGEELMLPAVRAQKMVGELVLGHSALGEVERILPPWPGYGPSRPTRGAPPYVSDDMRQVLESVRYIYNPSMTMTIVGFDRNKRLITVQYELGDGQYEPVVEALAQLTSLEEAYRDNELVLRRGHIGKCVIVETSHSPDQETKEVTQGNVIYLYKCAGK